MAGILTFDAKEVASLVAHAKAAKKRRPSYEDIFNPDYHKGGKIKEKDGWPDSGNIDEEKLPAALHLVKDHGVYLMSNGLPRQTADGTDRSVVAYAMEATPSKMGGDDWWEAARHIMGGDDCVITLPVEMFEPELQLGTRTIRLKVTPKIISVIGGAG